MSYRLSAILEGALSQTTGMASPREVIRNRDNKVVAYIDSETGSHNVGNELSKSDIKALGRLRRPE